MQSLRHVFTLEPSSIKGDMQRLIVAPPGVREASRAEW
ncbi:hypothetical protein EKH55_1729 [Sinorhizobium alkalisoli]|nr:hypothetical protein EKH55_1729 [Sinorhizobium alkalisoli]